MVNSVKYFDTLCAAFFSPLHGLLLFCAEIA